MNKKITLFETFSGLGSQLSALKQVASKHGLEVETLGSIEWSINAIVAYQLLHYGQLPPSTLSREVLIDKLSNYVLSKNTHTPIANNFFAKLSLDKLQKIAPYLLAYLEKPGNSTDIRNVDVIPKGIDIFTYSFPCQDISSQGKQAGLAQGTKSGLLYEIERILNLNKDHLPKILILENVSALGGVKFKAKLDNWVQTLSKLGYHSEVGVLMASDYGSVQCRKRLFVVSFLKGEQTKGKSFVWPTKIKHNRSLLDILDLDSEEHLFNGKINNYELSEFKWTVNHIHKARLLNYTSFNSENYVYSPKGFGPTLTASGANARLKIYFEDIKKIRFMTPKEAGLYMGHERDAIELLLKQDIFTSEQLMFLLGNSIPLELLKVIFNSILKTFFV